MPGPAAVRIVVDRAMTVVRVVAQVDDAILDETRRLRARRDADRERRGEELGKDRDDVDAQHQSSSPSVGSTVMTRASRSTLVTMLLVEGQQHRLFALARDARRARAPAAARSTSTTSPTSRRDASSTRMPSEVVDDRPRRRRAARSRRRARGRYRSRQASAAVRSAMPSNATMNPPLNGRRPKRRAARRGPGARSPSAVPAKTRRPDAKTASGASVIGSTTSSPRMPCALRTRPTMMILGRVMVVASPLRLAPRRPAPRRLQLARRDASS